MEDFDLRIAWRVLQGGAGRDKPLRLGKFMTIPGRRMARSEGLRAVEGPVFLGREARYAWGTGFSDARQLHCQRSQFSVGR